MENNNNTLLFIFHDLYEINVILINNEPWFSASNVCGVLGYSNTSKAIKDHCINRYVTKRYIPHPQSPKKSLETIFISEGNLYRLIIKSQKPEAKPFESWVCDEVLPQIRKTGSYQSNENSSNQNWEAVFEILDERYAQIEAVSEFTSKAGQHLKHLYQEIKILQAQVFNDSASDYVYVFHNRQTDEYKIGKSGDVLARQKALQIVEPNIYIFFKIPMQSNRHATLWERTLQTEFESKRVHGEWFKLSENDLAMLRLMARLLEVSK